MVSVFAALPTVLPFFGYEPFGAKRTAQHEAKSYFKAWTAGDMKSLQAMAGRASPKSPAYNIAVAQYQAWLAWSRDTRMQPPKAKVEYTENYTISVCMPDDPCDVYGDFTFDATSKLLTDYTVNGVPIRGNVMGTQDWAQVGQLWFRVVGGWISVHNGLQVTVEVVNYAHSSITIIKDGSVYYDYDDVYHPADSLVGRPTLRPGQRGLIWLNFRNQVLDGTLSLCYLSAAPNSLSAYESLDLRAD